MLESYVASPLLSPLTLELEDRQTLNELYNALHNRSELLWTNEMKNYLGQPEIVRLLLKDIFPTKRLNVQRSHHALQLLTLRQGSPGLPSLVLSEHLEDFAEHVVHSWLHDNTLFYNKHVQSLIREVFACDRADFLAALHQSLLPHRHAHASRARDWPYNQVVLAARSLVGSILPCLQTTIPANSLLGAQPLTQHQYDIWDWLTRQQYMVQILRAAGVANNDAQASIELVPAVQEWLRAHHGVTDTQRLVHGITPNRSHAITFALERMDQQGVPSVTRPFIKLLSSLLGHCLEWLLVGLRGLSTLAEAEVATGRWQALEASLPVNWTTVLGQVVLELGDADVVHNVNYRLLRLVFVESSLERLEALFTPEFCEAFGALLTEPSRRGRSVFARLIFKAAAELLDQQDAVLIQCHSLVAMVAAHRHQTGSHRGPEQDTPALSSSSGSGQNAGPACDYTSPPDATDARRHVSKLSKVQTDQGNILRQPNLHPSSEGSSII
ncbi:uncharacterized protein MONBRDRAFT_25507 [Monosiga brevicollis MX1]|uniref:Uncharacterized protein n=1 Tax=Monosiga brevicollis TaxID=81824 RepID=A9UZL8_MONBE|nr:uncharacterized protein MONBRDRAFT_25507 [Monosiga brevicollis MX1]EDQ89253.1 predicted protein [Monosiga brevicollis MX1]|eukprot:XP_001745829.1 hypothetical protein [Monosiga brevicollis MX1]